MPPNSINHLPKYKKQPPKAVDDVSQPTAQRLKQAALEDGAVVVEAVEGEGGARVTVRRMLDGAVLELLWRRRVIDNEQYQCGTEFYRHWYEAGLGRSGVVDWAQERVDGGSFKPESETRAYHLGRWQKMVRDLGMIHSRVMCDCVLMGQTLKVYGLAHSRQKSDKLAKIWAQAQMEAALAQLVFNELGPKQTRRHEAMRG